MVLYRRKYYYYFDKVLVICIASSVLVTFHYLWQIQDHSDTKLPSASVWSPYPEDENWMLQEKSFRPDGTPVFIVEEHYEVLKYWFQAATLDIIPKTGNVLIHIDAHGDGATPFQLETIPLFHFPKDQNDVRNMMQENDMFIVAAALTGLFDHYIWIYPDWGPEAKEYDGIVVNYAAGQTSELLLCLCIKSIIIHFPNGNSTNSDYSCKARPSDDSQKEEFLDDDDWPPINQQDCYIKVEHFVVELIKESRAADSLKAIDFKDKKGSVVLDIDEDYFGCWTDIYYFNKNYLEIGDIEDISELVSDFFCATNSAEEKLADDLYTALIRVIVNLKKDLCSKDKNIQGFTNEKCIEQISDFVLENIFDILALIKTDNIQKVFCSEKELLNLGGLKRLLLYLNKFDIIPLESLSNVGICFQTSPSHIDFQPDLGLHVCHGSNVPNDTMVFFHYPGDEEIRSQTKKFKEILSSINTEPNLIGICRSVRDGYTPKEKFQIIERSVVKAVSSVFGNVKSKNIQYDGNLLGGALGWPERLHSLNKNLLAHLKVKSSYKHT